MAVMQPRDFICEVETVRWVYDNTEMGSLLRGFIIKIFCQRGPGSAKEIFQNGIEKLGVLRDESAFLWVLHGVRKENSKLVEDGEVDSRRVEYPLPEFLVWGEKWETLPDMHFVGAEGALGAAEDVARQLGGR